MTISTSNRKAGPFTGNGVTVDFPFTFKVFTAADVLVVQAVTSTGVETTLALTTDYTVALNSNQDVSPGGTITMLVAPPTGTTLVATSQVSNLQPLALTNAGGFYPTVLNDALDRLTILAQQLAEKASRALTFNISSGASGALPNPVSLALLGWNAAGTALQNFAGAASVGVSTFMATVVAAVDAAAARVALGVGTVGDALFVATTKASGRAALDAAALGANGDLTSLSALTSINGGQIAGFRNFIHNGDMRVWQRKNTITDMADGTHVVDRWRNRRFGVAFTATMTTSRQAYVGPTEFSFDTKYQYVLRHEVVTAQASLATSNVAGVTQKIEDFHSKLLEGRTFTLSFWVKASLAGQYGVAFGSLGYDSSVNFGYTIDAANTWQKVSITVPGGIPVAAGSGEPSGLTGLEVLFVYAAHVNTQSAPGVWAIGSSARLSTTGQVNLLATTGNRFELTGVQLELGTVATEFEIRPYATELAMCQRYYFRLYGDNTRWLTGLGYAISTVNLHAPVQFPVPMRAAPSAVESSGFASEYLIVGFGGVSSNPSGAPTFWAATVTSGVIQFGSPVTLTSGAAGVIRGVNSSSFLGFSADL